LLSTQKKVQANSAGQGGQRPSAVGHQETDKDFQSTAG